MRRSSEKICLYCLAQCVCVCVCVCVSFQVTENFSTFPVFPPLVLSHAVPLNTVSPLEQLSLFSTRLREQNNSFTSKTNTPPAPLTLSC